MIRNRFHPFLAFVGLMAVGCASRQTFDVTVTNRVGDPITVWMTKAKPASGDQYERGWMPPEVVAVGTVGSSRSLGGVAVEPGETAHTSLTGTIASDDVAILRVYRAADLNAILALNRGSPDRLDIPLDPGKTDIDIVRQNGQLVDVPHGATTGP
jgi:hypothetical protein